MSLSAYEPYGPHTSDKWQIWAYSSAAPSFIGDNAAIIGSSGEVLREGTNAGHANLQIQGHIQKMAGRILMKLWRFVMMMKA